jgi:hypothetical protein
MAYRGGSVLAKSSNGSRAFSAVSNRAISLSLAAGQQSRSRNFSGASNLQTQRERGGHIHITIHEGDAKQHEKSRDIPKLSNQSTGLDNTVKSTSKHPSSPALLLKSREMTPPDIDRRKVLFACLFSLLCTQTLFLNVENVLPTYIPDNH